jgi:hypothetical protein
LYAIFFQLSPYIGIPEKILLRYPPYHHLW